MISGNSQIGIRISDADTRRTLVSGNFIGTDPSGTYAIPNGLSGVFMRAETSEHVIGSADFSRRNIISGNLQAGVVMSNSRANAVLGNFIGTDITGTYAIGNRFSGVSIENDAKENIIGGDFEGAGNLISGNGELGIYLAGEDTRNNRILGNMIGTDVNGSYAIGNSYSGIGIFNGAKDTIIGGIGEKAGNLISGNAQFGVAMNGVTVRNATIVNNRIGTDSTGTQALPNAYGGIVVELGARGAVIGGDTPQVRNLISGNNFSGIAVRDTGSGDVTIIGNFIGSDVLGQSPLPNATSGIRISVMPIR